MTSKKQRPVANRNNSLQTQFGMTLVELMVALTLGLIITGAVIQTYLSSKQTFRMSNGVNRIQENARFAHFFLTNEVRKAGYSTCVGQVRNKLNGDASKYISFNTSVLGWDFDGTNTGDAAFSLSDRASLDVPVNDSKWSGAGDLPAFAVGKVASGSDVLWFKNFEPLDIVIKTHNDNASPIVTESAHGVANNSILMVGDCTQVEMFQHLSNGNGNQVSLVANEGRNGDPGNRRTTGGVPNWARTYGPEDKIFGFTQTLFYIDEGAGGGPALFRYKTNQPDSAITTASFASESEELVEGVETLQILYGEDLSVPSDGHPNAYVSANQVSDWNNVVSVRLGLLMKTTENVTDSDQSANFTLLDAIEFTHPSADNQLRYSVNTTVKLRNRGLDENLSYYICDITADGNSVPTCS